jgi:glycerol-3-phosphate dehydrogenase
MWSGQWRDEIWKGLRAPWDLIVIGGGITGAAILREASRMGYRALLVEQGDFASGTSSRSSKLVHGGLRYIKEGKLHLTYSAVRERERLLAEAPGLVEPLNFLMPHYRAAKPKRIIMAFGLTLYDVMAGAWSHRYYPDHLFTMLAPHIRQVGLRGGSSCGSSWTPWPRAPPPSATRAAKISSKRTAAYAASASWTHLRDVSPRFAPPWSSTPRAPGPTG